MIVPRILGNATLVSLFDFYNYFAFGKLRVQLAT